MDLKTATEIFKQVENALDSQVSDIQIADLATAMVRWEDFAPFFKLSEAEMEEIRRNEERNYRLQKRAALRAWRRKSGKNATVRSFLNEVDRINKRSFVETKSTSVLETFRRYLVECYALAPHPSQDGWPFSQTAAYVDLPLFEAPITEEEPGNQQNAQPRQRVGLSDIFLTGSHRAKRKVILLEGVAGSGKTTLTWHAYQKWAEGKLFQSFPLLIHVPLEDHEIRSATCLADIIPHPSPKMREAIAEAIAEQHGKGVCFLFDGWDELPPTVQQRSSFLYKLISGRAGRAMLSKCSIIVTSRPAASGSLYPLLTSRIVIGRLDKTGIDDLLNEHLPPEESEELLRILEQRPQLANLCNLPINAMIVVHLFRDGVRRFPETRTGLFKAFLWNLLIRHIKLRTEHDEREFGDQFEIDQLPNDVLERFASICFLAFKGIMEHSKVFKLTALKAHGLISTNDALSLMEAHLTTFGLLRSFAFLHYSVQEFLAAWHMSRLGSEEQAKAVSDILHSSPLSPVLPFFAGLTGLSNQAVRDILLEVVKYPLDYFSVLANRPREESADRRRLALALVNCIYETQNSTFCEGVQPPVNSLFGGPIENVDLVNISFQYLGLGPSDCLSIGYLMAHHGRCTMDLDWCNIGDAGIVALMTQLVRSGETSAVSCSDRRLHLRGNRLTPHCIKAVSPLLKTSLLSMVAFVDCWPPAQAALYLKYLIEGLSRRSTLFSVNLAFGFTDEHVHYLVLLITTCPLEQFYLSGVNIRGSIQFIAEALKQNTQLRTLSALHCIIGDRGLVHLGRKARTSIDFLTVTGHPFTSSAVKEFLRYQFFSRLKVLEIGRPLNDEEMDIYRTLNMYRDQTNLPQLTVVDVAKKIRNHVITSYQDFLSMPENVQTRTSKE